MTDNELRAICQNVVKRGRADATEKKAIAHECEARGIALNKRCPNCYVDAATIIHAQLPKPEEEETEKRYKLRPGIDVIFGNTRINETTITDELAERLIAHGFSTKWFEKHPGK